MLRGNIEVKLTADGTRWYVVACSANIGNTKSIAFPSAGFFLAKDTAITEMKHRIMAWFRKHGRKETEEKVEWRVP